MAKFVAYYSYYNTKALTAYASVGSFNTIEEAYFYLFQNQNLVFAADDVAGNMKHPSMKSVDCFVKHGGKRVYLDNAQRDRVMNRLNTEGVCF